MSSCLKRARISGLEAISGRMTFKRYDPVQLAVAGLVDRAHPAFAEKFENIVAVAQHAADLQQDRRWKPLRCCLSLEKCRVPSPLK